MGIWLVEEFFLGWFGSVKLVVVVWNLGYLGLILCIVLVMFDFICSVWKFYCRVVKWFVFCFRRLLRV